MENAVQTSGVESSVSDGVVDLSNSDSVESKDVKSDASSSDELVEISLGSVKTKLPRAMAEAVKNLERGAQKAFQDGASAKKAMKEFEGSIKQNPRAALEKLGIDPYDFAEMTLAEKLEAMSLSPEEREHRDTKEKLAHYEEREKLAAEERERQDYSAKEVQMIKAFDTEIADAFKESGLPKHKYYVQLIAAEMLGASKRGEDLQAKEAASRVKTRFETQVRDILENMDPEGIHNFLSDSARKKLRDFDVKRVTAGSAPTSSSGNRPVNSASGQVKKSSDAPMSEKEWRAHMQSLKT